ncbi:hypothetical protein TeGR_g6433, partial [Tetraparma gracilis]
PPPFPPPRYHVTAQEGKEIFAGRNLQQPDVLHDHDAAGESKHGTLEDLHRDGVHATPLEGEELDGLLKGKESDFLFVDFYAPWCVWCQRLEPTWEKFAAVVDAAHAAEPPTMASTDVVKVDCEANSKYCGTQAIAAFPTLRMFHQGKKVGGDYKGDRTIEGLTKHVTDSYAALGMKVTDQGLKKGRKPPGGAAKAWVDDDHPGCRLTGSVWVSRVPGRIQIEAKSNFQDMNAKNTNVSHVVHHIGFGTSLNKRTMQKLNKVPEEYRTVSPMNGNVYKTDKLHTAHHHHLYVVPTKHLNPSDASLGERVLGTFVLARLSNFARAFTSPFSRSASFNYHQLSYQSQLIEFPEDKVPAVTFAYDFSPLEVTIQKESMPTYEFIVKMLALIGGTYTMFSLTERSVKAVSKKMR